MLLHVRLFTFANRATNLRRRAAARCAGRSGKPAPPASSAASAELRSSPGTSRRSAGNRGRTGPGAEPWRRAARLLT